MPGIGEDIAAWVSYGAAKKASKHPENFGKGEYAGVISCETGNNACIGGAIIPLLTLGVPGSPPAAMLLGALMIHNVTPGPMISIEHPHFITEVTAILMLASFAMFICGILLAKQVVKVLRIPPPIFMPIVLALCVIGSYSLRDKGIQPLPDGTHRHSCLFYANHGISHRSPRDRGDSRTDGR